MEPGISLLIGIALGAFVGVAFGKHLVDDSEHNRLLRKKEELELYHKHREQVFSTLVAQAKEFFSEAESGMLRGRKWLAQAFSEFVDNRNLNFECWLAVKPHPAHRASEDVKALRRKCRENAERAKFLEYQVSSYEEYFPILREYRDAILDESVDLRYRAAATLEKEDPALTKGYLNKQEYEKLSTTERNQLALDRYWERNKSRLEIGRVYERYIGYLYEQDGWRVTYEGILKGFEDFGRDLVCRKDAHVHIVQCKYWSQHKEIREKHIFQLFGTTVLFKLREAADAGNGYDNQMHLFDCEVSVTPVFATPTPLSSDARSVARHLEISIRSEKLSRYPMIKCNINRSTDERIYHLPFDQQYDNTVVGDIEGEFYAETVAEAEKAGFRRAYRWRGN